MKAQIDATARTARREMRLWLLLAAGIFAWLLPSAASATCRDVRTLLRQGYAADEVSAALGLTFEQINACAGGVTSGRNRAVGPAPRGAAGPAPFGAAGPAPLGAAGPAPLGAAGPAPLGAAGPAPRGAPGPAPLGAAGPAPGH
jgi:hypothetical protein